ncbi:MAG: WecB/TagA/CpsF family glycosyltransferase, partial [Beijerinckiaceae bacterium]|nr:WecB/TagA/CpsF family glycosyltransferase [Beijerinckiaceae bacterium]
LKILRNRHSGLQIAGAETPDLPGELKQDAIDQMAQRINVSGAAVCVLSLGAPKQELLADALYKLCPGVGFICVGAALDFISGHAKRAPGWTQRLNLEWFWRLANNPLRLGRGYGSCAMALFKLALPGVFPNALRLRMEELVEVDATKA